jgi:hypothetical protein
MHFILVTILICTKHFKWSNANIAAWLWSPTNNCLKVCDNSTLVLEIGTISINWAQLSRFYLKTETESSLRNVVFCNTNRTAFLDKGRTMDDVQKYNIRTSNCFLTLELFLKMGLKFSSETLVPTVQTLCFLFSKLNSLTLHTNRMVEWWNIIWRGTERVLIRNRIGRRKFTKHI